MKPNWPKVRLGELLKRSEEILVPAPETEYREITVRLWGRGVIERGRVDGASLAGSRRYLARSGQFIASRIDARNGAMGIVPHELDGAVVTNDFPLFNLCTDRLEPSYFGWLSRTRRFVDLCQRSSEGTTNRVRLKEDRFLALDIPLPPLAEQQRVVKRIEELRAAINEARVLRQHAAEEAQALVGARAAALFREATQRGLVALESVATLERGKFSHRPRNDPRFFGGPHPWIQIGEIESAEKMIRHWTETLTDEGLAISKKFAKGTVLISIAATIGSVGILGFDCCVPDSIVAVIPRGGTDSEFLYHYLRHLRSHLEEIAPQSAQKNINLQILGPLPVPNLSPSEQQRIVVELDGLQAKVDAMKHLQAETATELDALLPAVLDRAFKGEL